MGAIFSDITLYTPTPHIVGTPEFQEETALHNFVSDLYLQKMNGYKPPNKQQLIPMKGAILFILTFLSISKLHSQSLKNEEIPFDEISQMNGISYAPTDTITKTAFSIKKFENKEVFVELIFITKRLAVQHGLHIDSILLQSTRSKIFLYNPIKDTVYYQNDGSLCNKIFHRISIAQFDLLKKEPISEIILRYGNAPVHLRLIKRSQVQITREVNSL